MADYKALTPEKSLKLASGQERAKQLEYSTIVDYL